MEEAIKYDKYEVESLLQLSKNQEFKLERIFDVYKQSGGKFFYYNIFNSVRFPSPLHQDAYTLYYTKIEDLWTVISFRHYGRIDLWWIVASINGIDNTFIPLPPGTKLMIPTPVAIRSIIDSVRDKL
jgi:hypothetical protein